MRRAADAWHSDTIIIGTFFNGGLRAYDISNPYSRRKPAVRAEGSCIGAARHDQLNTYSLMNGAWSTRSTVTSAALHPRNGFLMLHFPSPDIGLFGRRQRHVRGHRVP